MATLRIFTQYYENYSDTQTPYWKPKGGQTFIIKDIEGDMIMYCDNLKEVCSNLVSAKSNEHVKYEYRDHDVDFIGDEEISIAELTKEVRDQFNGEGNYKSKDIPGFEGTLEQLNDLTIKCSADLDRDWANESENLQ
tara:strand:+ start:1209 stop:1619 length:411 start_codon:yes stop_codon:yes gene_type:complete